MKIPKELSTRDVAIRSWHSWTFNERQVKQWRKGLRTGIRALMTNYPLFFFPIFSLCLWVKIGTFVWAEAHSNSPSYYTHENVQCTAAHENTNPLQSTFSVRNRTNPIHHYTFIKWAIIEAFSLKTSPSLRLSPSLKLGQMCEGGEGGGVWVQIHISGQFERLNEQPELEKK